MDTDQQFIAPNRDIMLTAMVLQDIKDALENQKNGTVIIAAETPNDYYWAMYDPSDEEMWLDNNHSDIRQTPSFRHRIADDKQKALERLKDNGAVRNIRKNMTAEDIGPNHYLDVTKSFEVEINPSRFLSNYAGFIEAAQPALNQYLQYSARSGRQLAGKVKETRVKPPERKKTLPRKQPQSKTSIPPQNEIKIHPLEPKHYSQRKGTLTLSPILELTVTASGKTTRPNGKKYLQCSLLEQLFKNVNRLKYGATFSSILSVKDDETDKKTEKKIRNTVTEINHKVAAVGGPDNLIKVQNRKVFVNNSYL